MSIILPLDLTGKNPDNRLGFPVVVKGITTSTQGETISTPYGLFHSNATLIDTETNQPLTLGEDYALGLEDIPTFKETGIKAYSSVVLINPGISGRVHLYANYLGDKYTTASNQDVPDLISLVLLTKRAVLWDALIDKPESKPPVDHAVLGEEITTGLGSITGRLWAAWINKQTVGPELITSVAASVLKKMQSKEDTTLHTVNKTIEGGVNELHARSSLIFGGGGVRLDYLGTFATHPSELVDVSTDGYFLIGDPVNGGTLQIGGLWEEGQSVKSIASGSVLGVIGGKLKDITKEAGPYGLADVNAGAIYEDTLTFREGIKRLYLLAQPNTGTNATVVTADTDLSSLTEATEILCTVNASVRGRWKDTTWISSRLVPAGTVVDYVPSTGLVITTRKPMREDLGDLPITSSRLNTTDKTTLGAVNEIRGLGPLLDYSSGDLITVVKDTPVGAGAVKAGSTPVSRSDYPNLFALWSTTYGIGDGSTTFGVPSEPSFGGSLYTVVSGAPLALGNGVLFIDKYTWVIDIGVTNMVWGKYDLTDRSEVVAPVSIVHNMGETMKFVGIIGNLMYYTWEAGGPGLWTFNLINQATIKLCDLPEPCDGELSVKHNKVFLVSTTKLLSVDLSDNSLTTIADDINLNTVNEVGISDYADCLYVASSGGLVKVSFDGLSVVTLSGAPATRVCVAEDRDLVLAQENENGVCYRFRISDNVEVDSSTSVGWLIYHPYDRSYRTLTTVAETHLAIMNETPIYEYYFKE